MKVILSRKGFDTQYGGVPNAVLPDGSLLAFPIEDGKSIIRGDEIRRGGESIGLAAEQLTGGKLARGYRAHLDPDLDFAAYPRRAGWRQVLGQTGSALGHLQRQGVGPGDLFLFFAWFRPVERQGQGWAYVSDTPPVHLFWGWLHVGAVHAHTALPASEAGWLAYHPHLQRSARKEHRLYVASDGFTVGGRRVAGGGTFPRLEAARVLTAPGETMSAWSLPVWLHPDAGVATLTFHSDAMRWGRLPGGRARLQTVGRGQEFVLTTRDAVPLDEWLGALFSDVATPG